MLKAAMFQAIRAPWPVVYLLNGDECVYTGVTPGPSTINFTGPIIDAISKQEQRDPRSLRFFDLQTALGYRSKSDAEFEFNEVALNSYGGRQPHDDYIWLEATCPAAVIEAFWAYISSSGAEPSQIA